MDDLPIKCQVEAITPAANHLFRLNKTARNMSKGGAQAFHTIVAKLLFLCKQSRPDILTGVTFLTTRVRELDEYEDKKLGSILKYLSSTRDLVLTL